MYNTLASKKQVLAQSNSPAKGFTQTLRSILRESLCLHGGDYPAREEAVTYTGDKAEKPTEQNEKKTQNIKQHTTDLNKVCHGVGGGGAGGGGDIGGTGHMGGGAMKVLSSLYTTITISRGTEFDFAFLQVPIECIYLHDCHCRRRRPRYCCSVLSCCSPPLYSRRIELIAVIVIIGYNNVCSSISNMSQRLPAYNCLAPLLHSLRCDLGPSMDRQKTL